VRKRVLALPAVMLAPASDAVGLTSTADGRKVTGVRILRRAPGSAEETLPADLVIDTTGRASRTPAWLETLEYPRPPEERVRIDLDFARSLPSPDIYRAIRDAEPIDEPATCRFPASVRRRYERL
jgi:hypothetical protein